MTYNMKQSQLFCKQMIKDSEKKYIDDVIKQASSAIDNCTESLTGLARSFAIAQTCLLIHQENMRKSFEKAFKSQKKTEC